MKIKICGIKYKENLKELVELKPDYLGFIFYKKSKRFMVDSLAPIDLGGILPEIKKVGVFVNEEIPSLLKLINQYQLDVIQLHGDESPEYVKDLKKLLNLNTNSIEVFKAFGVDELFDLNKLNDYKQYCDYFLFDTKTANYGGSGKKFNWDVLLEYDNEVPIILSGGIDVEDIEEILDMKKLNIHAVDLNSKLEIEPGLKNLEKAKAAIKTVRVRV